MEKHMLQDGKAEKAGESIFISEEVFMTRK